MYRSAKELIDEITGLYDRLIDLFGSVPLVDRRDEVSGGSGLTDTICAPAPDQRTEVAELFDRYSSWARIVSAFLRRVEPNAADRFDAVAEELGSYFLLRRSGTDIDHDTWRRLFAFESRKLLLHQLDIVNGNSDEFTFGAMNITDYVDLDVTMTGGHGRYVADVRSILGSATTSFVLPYGPRDVENFVLRHFNPRSGTRRVVPTTVSPFAAFGKGLFDALVTDDVRDIYHALRAHARSTDVGVRLRLRQSAAPDHNRIPWEFKFAGTDFLCLEPRFAMSRHVDRHLSLPPRQVRYPLRVLTTISAPRDLP
jgi:hypothetical protein